MLELTLLPCKVALDEEEKHILGLSTETKPPLLSYQRNEERRSMLKVCYILKQSNNNAGALVDLSAKTLIRWRKLNGIEDLVQRRKYMASTFEARLIVTSLNRSSHDYAFDMLSSILKRPKTLLCE